VLVERPPSLAAGLAGLGERVVEPVAVLRGGGLLRLVGDRRVRLRLGDGGGRGRGPRVWGGRGPGGRGGEGLLGGGAAGGGRWGGVSGSMPSTSAVQTIPRRMGRSLSAQGLVRLSARRSLPVQRNPSGTAWLARITTVVGRFPRAWLWACRSGRGGSATRPDK